MILFRCWYCGKRYAVAANRVGERLTCACQHVLRVPERSGGRSKVWRPGDWLVESAVYGGGGALLGLGLGLVIVTRVPWFRLGGRWELIAGLTVTGFLLGVLGGERGVNWVGRMIRAREDG